MELALEAGAEDFRSTPEGYEILTEPGRFEAVHRLLESRGVKCTVAEVTYVPVQTAPLEEAHVEAVTRLIEALEEHDDVKEVHANADYPEPRA
jgi:transcriptional/translational regulatory protein YebC/TACO1